MIKYNLFEPPLIFKLIQESSSADDKEMYQVFNMGCRMEIYTDEKKANEIISLAKEFGVDALVIGRVEEAATNSLLIKSRSEIFY